VERFVTQHDANRSARRARRCGVLLGTSTAWLLAACGTVPPACVSPELTDTAVVFRYRDPVAQLVQISGSWETNFYLRGRDWSSNTRVGSMERGDDGVWELRVGLGPGRYEYIFLVDGRFWRVDPNNPERAQDGVDGWVSLLVVP